MIEKKPYYEDSSPEEIGYIKARVSLIDVNILKVIQLPIITPFSINTVFSEMNRLADSVDRKCCLVVDLRQTQRPDAATRKVINAQFQAISSKLMHVSFVTGKNIIFNTIARYVLFGTGVNSFSVNKTVEEGIDKIKDVIAKNG